MSVVIKGMQMPTSCYYCGLTDTSFINCQAFSQYKLLEDDCEERRPDWCPLVELPEHHGRLIDENEVRIVMNWLLTQPQRPTWNDTYNAIQEMNAVIEAEGADE